MSEPSQVHVIGVPAPQTWNDYEKGCLATYGGGHQGDEFDAFQHGMRTIFNLLRAEFPPAEQCKATPDLLAACKETKELLESICIRAPRGLGITGLVQKAHRALFGAIAKAEPKEADDADN